MSSLALRVCHFRSDRGAAGVEYAVCLGLLMLVAIAAIAAWGGLTRSVPDLTSAIARGNDSVVGPLVTESRVVRTE